MTKVAQDVQIAPSSLSTPLLADDSGEVGRSISIDSRFPDAADLSMDSTLSNGSSKYDKENRAFRYGRGALFQCLDFILAPFTDETGSLVPILKGLCIIFTSGTVLGLLMPKDGDLPTLWYRNLSSIVGYTYFLCWSISFYPQIVSNYRRRSTEGLSADFASLNVLGFACYATYTASFYWSKNIERKYKERKGEDAEITVQSNDVAFALHALFLTIVTLGQIAYYEGFRTQRCSRFVLYIFVGMTIACATFFVLIWVDRFTWLDFLYMLSFIKVFVSLIKYIPQVMLNVSRQSTIGWNIWNVILDLTGGKLSILQLIGDSADMNDFSGISGNPAKFCLGFVSIFFDIIFIVQHYFLYNKEEERAGAN